ncbi:MAG: Heimdall-CTERM domain-containing surface protein, partial [Candidatus Hodarchaeota archaeon]
VDVAVWGDLTHTGHIAMDAIDTDGHSMERDWNNNQEDTDNCTNDFIETTPSPGRTLGTASLTIPAPGFEVIAIVSMFGLGLLLTIRRRKH